MTLTLKIKIRIRTGGGEGEGEGWGGGKVRVCGWFRVFVIEKQNPNHNESHTYTLERDPSNRYDSKAIKILDLDGGVHSAHIGWVVRDDNQSLAPLMDAGHVFTLHAPARLTDSTYVFQCTDESEIETLLAYEAAPHLDRSNDSNDTFFQKYYERKWTWARP